MKRPYNLIDNNNSDRFYILTESFSKRFINDFKPTYQDLLNNYKAYTYARNSQANCTTNEYFIELLIIGVLWKRYNSYAQSVSSLKLLFLKSLYLIRSKFYFLKKIIDTVRGYFITNWLFKNDTNNVNDFSITGLKKLLLYIEASGDLNEEAVRIHKWLPFLLKENINISDLLKSLIRLANNFEKLSHKGLGTYTKDVNNFISLHKDNIRNKENYLFCSRTPLEYHLNILCAEILNKEFRANFLKTKKKIVLLPTCMQTAKTACSANNNKQQSICRKCSSECTINHISSELDKYKIETRLIPHSSGFSKYLKQWENNQDVGLVGVACILNLIRGGYEMKKLNIPSQCIFLDYAGCKKHWNSQGEPTALNLKRLKFILDIK